MAEKFYDVPGAAQVLGLKDETMRRWLRTGKVRGLRLGRDWRISERALDELAHKATNQPKKSTPAKDRGNPLAAEQSAKMQEFLRLADELHAELKDVGYQGTSGAELIRQAREERDKAISGS